MKKLYRSLLTIAISAPLLSGCDFFSQSDFPVETKEIETLSLRDYSQVVLQNQNYKYDGKVFVIYADETEKEVTSYCTFGAVDTTTLGEKSFKVSYETTSKIYSKLGKVTVVDSISLENIEITDYSESTKLGSTYTFDGVVTAYYNDGSSKIVTANAVVSPVDTSKKGDAQLVVSYTENEITKSVTKSISVEAELTSISVSGQTTQYTVGSEFEFDGNVYANYSDGSKVLVTSECVVDTSDVNIDQIGSYAVRVSYTKDGKTYNAEVAITVSEYIPHLSKITASNYSSTIDIDETYVFDGKVTATYDDNSEADVTSNCTFGTISTSTSGKKTLNISYTDLHYGTKKTTSVSIEVIAHVTGVSIGSSFNLGVGKTTTLSPTVTPSDAKNKTVTFESDNTSVASVTSSGVVTGNAVGVAHITVTSVDRPSVSATTTINVSAVVQDAWTILLYMCGADLESGGDYGTSYGGAATSDIEEILKVSGQPDDVNFVIQTGGAAAWQSKYGISAANNQRYHVANKSLSKDNNQVYTSYKGMGEASTLKDFLVWGINTYPADKIGVILWNHGGGLDGVCYDEKKDSNSLTNNEVVTAVSGALTETGLSKLEFIGYDACLMQMMEIAEFNAPYFNYQVAAQESEAGTGWDYDNWVDDLYAKKSSETIFKAIVDSFINDNGGVNGTGYNYQGQYYPADQTLSYLDLNEIADFKTAWEAMATQVKSKITSSNKSTFKNNVVGASKYFAGDDYTYYAEFDCYDFLDKLSSNSTFNPGGNYISNARTALNNLVKYNVVQKEGASDAHGLSFYFGKTYNSSTYSHFTNWVSLCSTVGGFEYSSGGGWW